MRDIRKIQDEYNEFINSKDIRDYLKAIHYVFSLEETSWLIFQCNSLSLEDKIREWEYLIEHTIDCTMNVYDKRYNGKSIHSFLHDYICLKLCKCSFKIYC